MILAIETSSSICSVCLIHLNGTVEKQLVAELENSHAEKLPVMVNDLLLEFGKNSVLAVALSSGPGSYTGLRIGTSLAKGLCYALNIPLIATDALKGLAHFAIQKMPNFDLVVPHLDARRNEVYMQIRNSDLTEIENTQAVILDKRTFENFENKKIIIVGNCPNKFQELCDFSIPPELVIQEPYALHLAAEAVFKYHNNQFEDLAYYEPFYLKNFVAGTKSKFQL